MKEQTHDPHFVVIGGGTGSFTVLSGLKQFTHNITALVSMADDGGSTGVLRDELGVLPPGDVRQCLVALSNASQPLRELFNFRFEEGSLGGHSFGNLFLSATEKMTDGDFGEAVRLCGEVLQITGKVVPITLDNIRLALQWGDEIVRGEGVIDVMDFAERPTRPDLFLEPAGQINPVAAQAIHDADVVVIAPGDIYTSLGPLLKVEGVAEALKNTEAKIVYVANLVINPRQTKGFTVADYADEIERFAGSACIDKVLYNTGKPANDALQHYSKVGETLVELDKQRAKTAHYEIIGRNLLSSEVPKAKKGDKLATHRSLIRHDPAALARALLELTTS